MAENKSNGNILVCLDNNNIIAYLWYIKKIPILVEIYGEEDEYIWVHSIFVDPSFSSRCRKILSKSRRISIKEGINKIYLDVYSKNLKSEKFHDKIGFEKEIYIYSKTLQ